MFKYRSLRKWKYQLIQDYVIETGILIPGLIYTDYFEMEAGGKLTIKSGYAWDGATFYPDFKDIMRGSLVHDCLLQMVAEHFIAPECRKLADNLLKKICLDDGMSEVEAHLVHGAVRNYSKSKGYV